MVMREQQKTAGFCQQSRLCTGLQNASKLRLPSSSMQFLTLF
jgi:hypothetical protein